MFHLRGREKGAGKLAFKRIKQELKLLNIYGLKHFHYFCFPLLNTALDSLHFLINGDFVCSVAVHKTVALKTIFHLSNIYIYIYIFIYQIPIFCSHNSL